MKKKRSYLVLMACVVCLTGCSNLSETETPETTMQTEIHEQDREKTQTETLEQHTEKIQIQTEQSQAVELKDLLDMVGMKDEDTADLLGGGKENWTSDKSFYIGRIYQTDLYGNSYKVFTTCGEDKIVESVSLWIVNGERKVTDAEVEEWEKLVTDMMRVESVQDAGVSEGGSRNIRWIADGMNVGMNQMEDILTISFQPAVGELE